MTQLTVHRGGCHCGRVAFEVEAPARLRLVRGEGDLTAYTFNTGTARHRFCRHCGVKSFYIPRSNPDGYSVNARCLDPATIEGMDVEAFDGRNWEDSAAAALAHLSRD